MVYLPRNIAAVFKRYLKSFCAVGLTGPRQSGKTTFLQENLKGYQYVSMDDFNNLDFFNQDPQAFINTYNDKVIFDEVHYAPKLFNYIKVAIDNDRQRYGKFVLTSSSQFMYLKHVTESLAGRIGLLSLLPLEFSELPSPFTPNVIVRGSYPELVLTPAINRSDWYNSYMETYLDKDVRQLSNIGRLNDFRKFIRLLAGSVGNVLDMQSFAKNLGVTIPTIKNWLSILEASYIIYLLPPFYDNYGKRIVKRPKVYFYDTGLVCFLTGVETVKLYQHGPMAGHLFENYIISEILKKEKHAMTHAELYYLCTSNHDEIDLIIDRKGSKELIEIKKSASFSPRYAKTLKTFVKSGDKAYVLYQGKKIEYDKDITFMPFMDFLG